MHGMRNSMPISSDKNSSVNKEQQQTVVAFLFVTKATLNADGWAKGFLLFSLSCSA
jgi:hypothetical protein